jgi:hypothetical protein
MLLMALPRQLDRGAMSLSSHAGDGSVKATLPRRDIGVESCWRWCCRRDVGRGMMSLPSHAGDGAVEATWPQRDRSHDVRPESGSIEP